MELHNVCLKCAENSLEYIGQRYVESELGFKIKTRAYRCNKCGSYYITCPECAGNGYTESFNSFDDCSECFGSGKVEIDLSLLFEL